MSTLTPEYFVQRWSAPMSPRLIKERLIDEVGRCCAQGDVLRCAGFSNQQLREITQETADREVARLLGITVAESILIHIINDSTGRPQDLFKAPERVLGPHHRLWTAFARHIDQMPYQDWERVAVAWTAAWATARDAAGAAVRDAARAAEWGAEADAALTAAWGAAWTAMGAAEGDAAASEAASAAASAARELVGWSKLAEPFFLKMFFDDPWEWVRSIEDEDN